MVHAAVILYNYYHRKQFPHLDFADPKRFSVSASLAVGEALHAYLNQVHDSGGNGAGPSVTDKAVVEACGIAEALDAQADAPEITTWPVSKVAVLLVDPTRKWFLIEHSTLTKGVWSIIEKDITTSSPSNTEWSRTKAVHSELYMLQQVAFSVVKSKTGMERASLHILEDHLVYSLSQKETSVKLFVMQYDQTVNKKLKEVSLEDLIGRMSGPLFRSDPCPSTTSVVEFYHLLPYKDVMLNLLNRERCLDSSQSVPKEQPFRKLKSSSNSERDERSKGHEATNSKKITPDASVLKKRKLRVKEGGSCITSKKRKNNNLNSKRKSKAPKSPATATEHRDGKSVTEGNGSLNIPDGETSAIGMPSILEIKQEYLEDLPILGANTGNVTVPADEGDPEQIVKENESAKIASNAVACAVDLPPSGSRGQKKVNEISDDKDKDERTKTDYLPISNAVSRCDYETIASSVDNLSVEDSLTLVANQNLLASNMSRSLVKRLEERKSKHKDENALLAQIESLQLALEVEKKKVQDLVVSGENKDMEISLLSEKATRVEELTTENENLAKSVSSLKESCVRGCLEIHNTMSRSLKKVGAQIQPFNGAGDAGGVDIYKMFEWTQSNLRQLPSILSEATDYAASAVVKGTLAHLEKEECSHFRKFGQTGYSFDGETARNPSMAAHIFGHRIFLGLWDPFCRDIAREKVKEKMRALVKGKPVNVSGSTHPAATEDLHAGEKDDVARCAE